MHFPFPIVNKDDSNCLDCYRCLRNCPLDAIEFSSGRARIITDSCVVCGVCITECPQHTKRVISDFDFVVRALKEGKSLVLSLGESVLLCGKMTISEMADKAYDIGFDYIEETDVLEEAVMRQVADYVRASDKLVLASHCPVVVNLIEQHFPKWCDYLLPIPSLPSIHARDLKKRFPDHAVVHASACTAEFYNRQNDNNIDYFITMAELNRLLRFTPSKRSHLEAKDTYYEELNGGYAFSIIGNMSGHLIDDGVVDKDQTEWYSGLSTCIDILKDHDLDANDNVQFLELMACDSGCVNSIDISRDQSIFTRTLAVKQYNADRIYLPNVELSVPLPKADFHPRLYVPEAVDVAAVRRELKVCFADTDAKALNCGACGYDSCYMKSQAVVRGQAERDMCISYMKAKAETFANAIFNDIENGILVFDKDYKILQANPYVKKMFAPLPVDVGTRLTDIMDISYLRPAVEKNEVIHNVRIAFKELGLWTQQTVQPLEAGVSFVAFINDITEGEKQREQFNSVKRDLLNNANQVINDQMRTAQEIASLLGETTAATKITLQNLVKEFEREKELT
jgi:iron only hydrogenase large subunit-like protein